MRALLAALGMFTLLPVPPVMEMDEALRRRIMAAFPWAGLVCGLVAAAVAGVVAACGAGQVLAAMSGLVAQAGVTGAMHLDGVADTADGLASRKGPEDALALMKRSDIGPMGVATLVLVLLLQAAALASPALGRLARVVPVTSGPGASFGWLVLSAAPLAAVLAVMPAVGRVSAVNATVAGIPGARPQGFGALFTGITRRTTAVADALAVLLVTTGAGWLAGGLPLAGALAVAAVVAWGVAGRWQRHLLRRLGGLTGDTFGSLIEVTQTTFVVLGALFAGLLR